MTTPDLLKLCDDVLELSGRATKGPWKDAGHGDLNSVGFRPPITVCVDLRQRDMDLIATSRTALPILASALKKLVPYVRHLSNCTVGKFDGENRQMPCSCRLSFALSEIEGKVSGG